MSLNLIPYMFLSFVYQRFSSDDDVQCISLTNGLKPDVNKLTVMGEEEKQQILVFEKQESANTYHFFE